MNKERLLTPSNVASLLGVSPITIRKWSQRGLLPAHVTAGGHRRFSYMEVEHFAQARGMTLFSPPEQSLRILVVEDDRHFSEFLHQVLSDANPEAELEAAYDGFEAGRKVIQFQPSIVLLDLMLPGLDGFAVCEQLSSDPETRQMRIIAMTGYYSGENVQRILAAGAETCLGKPFTPQELLKALGLERGIATIPL